MDWIAEYGYTDSLSIVTEPTREMYTTRNAWWYFKMAYQTLIDQLITGVPFSDCGLRY
jgi:hypothetical protein